MNYEEDSKFTVLPDANAVDPIYKSEDIVNSR